MKALVYRGPRDIAFADAPEPSIIEPHQAIVDVVAAGICGSDLHIWNGHGFSDAIGYTVGHEALGIISRAGRDSGDLAVGTRVLIPASVGCATCDECSAGRVAACLTKSGHWSESCYGIGPKLQGTQAQQVLVPHAARNLVAVPDDVSDEAAIVLTDNAPTAWYGCRRARIAPGDNVVVIGLGPVGLMSVQCAFAMGAANVIGIDPVESRRSRAQAMGATALAAGEHVRDEVRLIVGRTGLDAVIDAVGSDETIVLAVKLVRVRGRVSVIGVNQSPALPFPMQYAQVKELEFAIGLCSVQAELPVLLRLTSSGRIRPGDVVSHRMPMSQGPEAYTLYASRDQDVSKIVLDPNR
ncbi:MULTISPECIES: zinc-binding dehydrogenase [unclassified Nocardia]|uniref:zinc-binding dehydrogenase n=1 Tax=unclassified Nocardia TaxID=2637762 RepID=UPI0034408FD3